MIVAVAEAYAVAVDEDALHALVDVLRHVLPRSVMDDMGLALVALRQPVEVVDVLLHVEVREFPLGRLLGRLGLGHPLVRPVADYVVDTRRIEVIGSRFPR